MFPNYPTVGINSSLQNTPPEVTKSVLFRNSPILGLFMDFFVFPFFLYFCNSLFEYLIQQFRVYRFQKIFQYPKFNCLFRIIELCIAGKQNAHRIHPPFTNPFQQIQSGSFGHFHIGKYDIHLMFFQDFHSLFHAVCSIYLVNFQCIPICTAFYAFRTKHLIIHDQYAYHLPFASCVFNAKRAITFSVITLVYAKKLINYTYYSV